LAILIADRGTGEASDVDGTGFRLFETTTDVSEA
jgi:hypothetical protein